ncbi:MAG: DUF4011 domain-containing protein [Bacteroides sp.]|nr:DUF4011 domain-containing protein [Bacteroides sp.]
MASITLKIEAWKKLLLDMGKRNRLLNFKETKRSHVSLTTPTLNTLYNALVNEEKTPSFPYARVVQVDDETEETYENIVQGDLTANKTFTELQRTLKVLRTKSRISIEELGINTLYLTFGMLKWKESDYSEQYLNSPIILVPVTLTVESLTSPYKLQLHEDEIVVNPTLLYKLDNDFAIQLPEFDSNETNIEEYLSQLSRQVQTQQWEVIHEAHLTILSFLKINMYKDLERNKDRITDNPIISAIAGDGNTFSFPRELENYDHDEKTRPIDTFQVMDADSSQQDAVLLSKHGTSFILQGPPGTGKSQTITNIISEALADGKKVLFVAEKMAALQVVYNRLKEVGLGDFCLTLHSHKANKKEILKELAQTLTLDKVSVRQEAIDQLHSLERIRKQLNQYQKELHTPCLPLNKTIYEINGQLSSLLSLPDLIFEIDQVRDTTSEELNQRIFVLEQFAKTMGQMSEDFLNNPWYNATVPQLTFELRHDIDAHFSGLLPSLHKLAARTHALLQEYQLPFEFTMEHTTPLYSVLSLASNSPLFPATWLQTDLSLLKQQAETHRQQWMDTASYTANLRDSYQKTLWEIDGIQIEKQVQTSLNHVQTLLNPAVFSTNDTLIAALNDIQAQATELLKKGQTLASTYKTISQELELEPHLAFSQLSSFKALLQALTTPPEAAPIWLEPTRKTLFEPFLEKVIALHNEVNTSLQNLNQRYDKEIVEIDHKAMLRRFRTDYTSFLKYLKPQYKKDKRLIRSLSTHSEKLTDASIIELLQTLKGLAEKQETIANNREKLQEYIGIHYAGLQTNWQHIREMYQTCDTICQHFRQLIPGKLKTDLLQQTLHIDLIAQSYAAIEAIDTRTFTEQVNALLSEISPDSGLELINNKLEQLLKQIEDIHTQRQQLSQHTEKELTYPLFLTDLSQLSAIQQMQQSIQTEEINFKTLYGFLYK